MKFTLPFIKKGQRLSADVVEVLAGEICIVNLQGDLIRIKNSTGRKFKEGDKIRLQVMGINPLSFKVVTDFQPYLDKNV